MGEVEDRFKGPVQTVKVVVCRVVSDVVGVDARRHLDCCLLLLLERRRHEACQEEEAHHDVNIRVSKHCDHYRVGLGVPLAIELLYDRTTEFFSVIIVVEKYEPHFN